MMKCKKCGKEVKASNNEAFMIKPESADDIRCVEHKNQ